MKTNVRPVGLSSYSVGTVNQCISTSVSEYGSGYLKTCKNKKLTSKVHMLVR